MRTGLIAGSIAAIIAALVSLPLNSPVDNVFNSLTVAAASLAVGIGAGMVWDRLAANSHQAQYFVGGLALGLVAVVVVAVAGNFWLDRSISFIVPLAAIAFAVPAILIPSMGSVPAAGLRWSAPALFIAAAGIGIGLVGLGDAESGELSLPERAETTTQEESTPTASEQNSLTYLVGDGSEVTFTVGEQLSRLPLPNEAVVRTTRLSGQINLDGQPSLVEVDMHSLASDQRFRDQYIRTRMFPNSPVASFTVDSVSDLPEEFFNGQTFTRHVGGLLSLNGVETPLTFDLEVRNDGDVLNVLGRTVFTWDQVQVRVPTARTVVSVEDEVSVPVLLVAQPR